MGAGEAPNSCSSIPPPSGTASWMTNRRGPGRREGGLACYGQAGQRELPWRDCSLVSIRPIGGASSTSCLLAAGLSRVVELVAVPALTVMGSRACGWDRSWKGRR
ncbi:hypothetical protein GQ55_9G445200 [Panicum hallii var. hallii]|uniref:Uncharacterized protein n=1 Tax=Panicum hallii var. hallii TaxID=1504633 RepID=A0A2T7CBJ5_9POAL|nr:hypothetical protein GQ55_9G445200 [Panicum hallii var. hallii]